MRYLTRWLEETLHHERKMAFVAGPRQVGKTTLARELLPDPARGYFNWDVESHRRALLHNPESFWEPASGKSPTRVVLDEIHKYPRWKRLLKGLFDARKDDLEILVTGSGRLDIYQKGGDSLLGRYALYRLHPFTVGEYLGGGRHMVPAPRVLAELLKDLPRVSGAGEALDLIDRFSGFPEPLFAARAELLRRWRRSRRQLILREDIRDLTRILDLGLIDHLVLLLPERIGSPISLNALREDLGVAFNTVKGWMEALGRLYVLFEIRPYAGRLARTLRREGKVYLFDGTEIEADGPRFENLVALHLTKLVEAWNDFGHGDFALRYVRDKEKREVDFLVTERGQPYLLLEAKLSETDVSPSLRYFKERLHPQHTVQLVRHATAVRVSTGIIVAPAERFLAAL